jgi:hypothetical protein
MKKNIATRVHTMSEIKGVRRDQKIPTSKMEKKKYFHSNVRRPSLHLDTLAEKETCYIKYGPLLLFQ